MTAFDLEVELRVEASPAFVLLVVLVDHVPFSMQPLPSSVLNDDLAQIRVSPSLSCTRLIRCCSVSLHGFSSLTLLSLAPASANKVDINIPSTPLSSLLDIIRHIEEHEDDQVKELRKGI